MSNVSLIDGHIDEPMFTDEQIKKALEICLTDLDCPNCPYVDLAEEKEWCDEKLFASVLDLINRKDAEIEELYKLLDKKILDIKAQETEIERLNKEVDRLSQCVMYHDGQIADAIKEFAERLCEGRVSNDPVVIAVKTELKLMEGKTK